MAAALIPEQIPKSKIEIETKGTVDGKSTPRNKCKVDGSIIGRGLREKRGVEQWG